MSENTDIAAKDNHATIRILAASALRSALTSCAKRINASDGLGFDIQWGTSGAVNKRMRDGEAFDLVAGARGALEELAHANLVRGEILALGASRLALGVRAGESAPDISTGEKFRTALVNARMISRGDPAGGGTAGNHLVKIFAQLGMTDIVAGKSILRAGGFDVMREVLEGRADFGLTQSTEIPAVEGVAIGAYLPAGVQLETVYAIAPCSKACADATAVVTYLKSEVAQKIIAGAGFAPA